MSSQEQSNLIDQREFVRHFSRYLKLPGTYQLTGRQGMTEVIIKDPTYPGETEVNDKLNAAWKDGEVEYMQPQEGDKAQADGKFYIYKDGDWTPREP